MRNQKLTLAFLLSFMAILATYLPNHSFAQETESIERNVTLLLHTRQLYENATMTLAQQPHIVKDGVTYIALRSLSDLIDGTIAYAADEKTYSLHWKGETLSYKIDSSLYRHNGRLQSLTNGQPFTLNGSLMVPLRSIVQHFPIMMVPELITNKIHLSWLITKPIPTPLKADFTTNKQEYRIGERIHYTDNSIVGSGKLTNRTWINNKDVFFEPGPQTITLQLEDEFGQRSTMSRTITITDEVLYTKPEYDLRYSDIGTKVDVSAEPILQFDTVTYDRVDHPFQLIRNNSPEKVEQEGIYYEDEINGHARLLIHQQNGRSTPINMYVVAENNNNRQVDVTLNNIGFSGSNPYVLAAGKSAVGKYLTDLNDDSSVRSFTIPAGGKQVIIPELSGTKIGLNHTVTLYADFYTTLPVNLRIIALDETSILDQTYPFLRGVLAKRDGKHTRGTFENANRHLQVNELLGEEKSRLPISDGTSDPYITGIDNMTGLAETNYGNRGVLYTVTLENVSPHTAIVLNGRGGVYTGAFLVNGEVINVFDQGVLQHPGEGAILYRTGNRQEKVTISFIPTSGSNLPLNLLFFPIDYKN